MSQTDRTFTGLVERTEIRRPSRVLNVYFPCRSESLPGSSISRRQHTVKHIHAPRYSFNKILRSPDTHQISWTVGWHLRRNLIDYVKHDRLFLANTNPADRIAIKANSNRALKTLPPQI